MNVLIIIMTGLLVSCVSCDSKRVIHVSTDNYSHVDFLEEKHRGCVYRYYETGELKSIYLFNIDSVYVSSMTFSKAGYLQITTGTPYYIVLKHDSVKVGDTLSFMVFVIMHENYDCVVTFDDEEIEVLKGRNGYLSVFDKVLHTPGEYISEITYRLYYKYDKMSEHTTKLKYVCYE